VRCYNCKKLGHFAHECRSGEGAKSKTANLAQDEYDSEVVILMAKTDTKTTEDTS